MSMVFSICNLLKVNIAFGKTIPYTVGNFFVFY